MQPSEFAKKYRVTVQDKFVDITTDDTGWEHTHYSVTLKHRRRTLTFDYRMGMGHSDFDGDGAIAAVTWDSRAGLEDFQEFCDNGGYDTDSRKAYEMWEACVKMRKDAHEWCTSEEMWQDLLELEY